MSDSRRADGPTEGYPVFPEALPALSLPMGKYEVRFARTAAELDAILRLRFEIFNLELGEGLQESFATGRDRDRFDDVCHHLLVAERASGAIVGTYRMQSGTMAARGYGFYSADEFQLDHLPAAVMDNAIEVGRASVAKSYRSRSLLFLLWRGLAAYMEHNRKRYLFGCCSLTSQDPVEGKRVMLHLEREGHVHPEYRVEPQPDWRCYDETLELDPRELSRPVELPNLFRIYLRYGAKVCGPPALDRIFKTIDYLVLLDVDGLDSGTRAMFFRTGS